MATALDEIMKRPYMLNDLAFDAQRLSAVLPPDNWDPNVYRPSRLERQSSGVLEFVSAIPPGRAVHDWFIADTVKPSMADPEDAKTTIMSHNEHSSRWTRICRWMRLSLRRH
jgi:hypothetical protein